jgi:hypothetical protein
LVHKHTITVGAETFIHRVPKSTRFEEMTPDEWAAYWPRMLDAVHQRVLPNASSYMQDDLARLAS